MGKSLIPLKILHRFVYLVLGRGVGTGERLLDAVAEALARCDIQRQGTDRGRTFVERNRDRIFEEIVWREALLKRGLAREET